MRLHFVERLLQSKSKLANMAESVSLTLWSLAFAPHFVNNDYATVELIYGTVHVCHEVLAWLWATVCSSPV